MSFVDQFIDWAASCLQESEEAQEFLLGRGVSSDQWMKHKIGFVNGDFDIQPENFPGHDPDICKDKTKRHLKCDVCRFRSWSSTWENEGGQFEQTVGHKIRNSIVLPLTSYSGQIVGFQVRNVKEKIYDTFVLRRCPEGYFFGTAVAMESIWNTNEVNLVEGPFDQLLYERLLAPNVLALATNQPGQLHVKFLERFVTKINFCLDTDYAGKLGLKNFLKIHGENFHISNIKLDYRISGKLVKDIGDFWKHVGDDGIRKYFKNRK